VDELNGEKIDIVRWNESVEVLIMASLKPAEISSIDLDPENRRARVIVPEDQLSLAIGKRGQNVRLAGKLCDWELDIVSEAEAAVLPTVEGLQVDLSEVPGIGEHTAKALMAAGLLTLRDIFDAGEKGLTAIEGIGPAKANEVLTYASELYEQLASEAMARARAGAKQESPPTPREILESMLPDSTGEADEQEPEADEQEPDAASAETDLDEAETGDEPGEDGSAGGDGPADEVEEEPTPGEEPTEDETEDTPRQPETEETSDDEESTA